MRVFVAVEISNKRIINSIKQLQKKINIDANPTKSENLHFTLQFLGEVSDEKVSQIIKVLHTIEFSNFNISLKGLGIFPRSNTPRIIWVGISNEQEREMLIELIKKVQKTLEGLGFSVKKPQNLILQYLELKRRQGILQKS